MTEHQLPARWRNAKGITFKQLKETGATVVIHAPRPPGCSLAFREFFQPDLNRDDAIRNRSKTCVANDTIAARLDEAGIPSYTWCRGCESRDFSKSRRLFFGPWKEMFEFHNVRDDF